MQHAADGVERLEAHNGFGAIVSDLVALVEHVQASISLIEREIAREMTIGNHENSSIIVLDDITPQYRKASTALNSCSANLGIAVQFLLDTGAYSRPAGPALGRRLERSPDAAFGRCERAPFLRCKMTLA
jgi:hypothetical protein